MSGRETSAEINVTAAEWAVRVNAAPLSANEQASLDLWLEGDTRRLGAFARARAVICHAQRAKALGPDFDPDRFLADEQAGAGTELDLETEPPFAERRIGRRNLLIGGSGALAASVLVAAGLSWQAAAETYSTRLGEVRLVPLTDGSTMTLNTASTAKVRFTQTERHIELLQGEALFDVARNSKPFTVHTERLAVRALGTSFSVSQLNGRPAEVLIRQGVVEIETRSAGRTSSGRAGANNRVLFGNGSALEILPVSPNEITRALAWREGMLAFEDVPLQQAAEQFARYSGTRIVMEDAAVGRETVTGYFAANNPEGFANSVALSLGLDARRTADTVILGHAK